MSARLVEVYLPDSHADRLGIVLERHSRRYWRESVPGNQEKYSCLVQQRYTERLLDDLELEFGDLPGFTAVVSQIEAVIPPVVESAETEMVDHRDSGPKSKIERFFTRDRISTDELYDDIQESLHVTPSFLLTVALSAIIAGLGMRSAQTAVVIGAMIIAPLLGPTMGIALAATVGNARLGRDAAIALAVGSCVAVLGGLVVGTFFAIDPLVAELRNRTIVQPADIALALACGMAGVLAFSRAASLTLVGVMIAVALVPPLTAAGIYLANGYMLAGANALFLFTVNLVCVNVAGIATFLFQGLPPKNWRMTSSILAIWSLVLVLLASVTAGRFIWGIGTLEYVGSALLGR